MIKGATRRAIVPPLPRSWRWVAGGLILWGLVLAIMLPMLYYQFYGTAVSDYPDHAMFAKRMVEQNALRTPHFLWHVLVAGTQAALDHYSIYQSSIALTGGAYLGLASVLCIMLRRDYAQAPQRPAAEIALPMAGTLGLMIAAPIFAGFALDHHLYFGYIGWATYHNPTIILLRPLALMHFWLLLKVFGAEGAGWADVFGLVATGIAGTLAKPNYAICVLPAACLFAGYRLLKRRPVNWRLLIGGVLAPITALLLWQWLFTYSLNASAEMEPSGIAFRPFAVMRYYSNHLLVKFCCSIAFPAASYALMRHEARRDPALNLGWALFGMGALATYLFAETGPRASDANFFWSGQITLFVLVVASYRFLARLWARGELPKPKAMALGGIFVLHVICGVIFYMVEFTTEHTYW